MGVQHPLFSDLEEVAPRAPRPVEPQPVQAPVPTALSARLADAVKSGAAPHNIINKLVQTGQIVDYVLQCGTSSFRSGPVVTITAHAKVVSTGRVLKHQAHRPCRADAKAAAIAGLLELVMAELP